MDEEIKEEIISWIKVVVAAILFSFILTQFIVVHANVPTGSMKDTVPIGSRIVGSRLAYMFSAPDRFDVVAFKFPDNEKEIFLKRIIGMPGETLEIIDGKVYINGGNIPLEDSFIREKPIGNYGPFEIPEDCYFMMGDNRNDSWDSKNWNNHYVKKEKILGKVLLTYYPEFKILN